MNIGKGHSKWDFPDSDASATNPPFPCPIKNEREREREKKGKTIKTENSSCLTWQCWET